MASIFLGVPRLLEVAKEEIDKSLIYSNEIKLDKESIYRFYGEVFRVIKSKYAEATFSVDASRKFALIFQKKILWPQ